MIIIPKWDAVYYTLIIFAYISYLLNIKCAKKVKRFTILLSKLIRFEEITLLTVIQANDIAMSFSDDFSSI